MYKRQEYRLILRQDNADLRLTPLGYEIGLIDEERWHRFQEKRRLIELEQKRAEETVLSPSPSFNDLLVSRETSPIQTGARLSELLKRPQLNYRLLKPFDPTRPNFPDEIFEQVEIGLKYEGYIKRQQAQIDEMRRLEGKKLPEGINFLSITGLRKEAREKLQKIRPENVGQASRISGVSPADISVLLIYLASGKKRKDACQSNPTTQQEGGSRYD